jgi:F0F1-type ATP synthase membrane subunit b/b'
MSLHAVFLLAAEEKTRNPVLPSSNELIYGVISFVIFFAFLAKVALPKLNESLAARKALIEDKIDAAEADRASTVGELRRELGGLAVDLAEKIVGQSLGGEAAQSQVIDSFISDLERA